MAVSNLKTSLVRRYQDWKGERQALDKQIDEIIRAYETLDEKRKRTERLDLLLDSVTVIMDELYPEWKPETAKPTRMKATKLPFEIGAVTRWCFDILRDSPEPLRSRTIAEKIMEMNSLDLDDTDLVERIRVAADASLRSHQKKGNVESIDSWPSRWRIVDHGDRPTT